MSRGLRIFVVAAAVVVGLPAVLFGSFVIFYSDDLGEPLVPRVFGALLLALAIGAVAACVSAAITERRASLALGLIVATAALTVWLAIAPET